MWRNYSSYDNRLPNPSGFPINSNMHGVGGSPIVSYIFIGMWIIFFIIIMAALIKWIFYPQKHIDPSTNDALGILKTRFAKGDLSKTEFDSMKKVIEE